MFLYQQNHFCAASTGVTEDVRKTWNEPDQSQMVQPYPFNHVHESEIGHIHEIDIILMVITTTHNRTFTEIHPKGDNSKGRW